MLSAEIAARLDGQLEGPADVDVIGVASVQEATGDRATFVTDARAVALLAKTRAACVLVPRQMPNPTGRCVIRVDAPRLAFGKLTALLHPAPPRARGVHPTAIVDETARLGRDVTIGPYCTVGHDAVLDDEVVLESRVTVHDRVQIGARTIVHAGAVLGGDGFGYAVDGDHYAKVPQLGGLVIGSDVEIGANSTIDRGTLNDTRIGNGTKIDNLVQIAHNCVIGNNVVIAAQTGVAGGAVLEDWVVVGGQVGIGDKVHIGAGSRVGAASALPTGKRVPPNSVLWGVPARPLKTHLRMLANLGKVEEMREHLEALRQTIESARAGGPNGLRDALSPGDCRAHRKG